MANLKGNFEMKKALIALLFGLLTIPALADNTIVENLQELIETRDAITNAIVERGGTVTSGALTNVPNEILSIPSGEGGGGPFGSLVDRSITMVTAQDLDGVTSIGVGAFQGCSSLESIEFPPTLTSIGNNAFNGCWELFGIRMPDDIANIGSGAFNGCTNLALVEFSFVMDAVPELYNSDAFSGLPNNYQIWVPGERLADWKNTENWIDLASHIYPFEAIDNGQCVSEGNGMSRVLPIISGTFDADAAFNFDDEGVTMLSTNSTLWIGDIVTSIDDSRFESDFGAPMHNEGGDSCWGYLKFCNIPQEVVETWSGYPWGFPTNKISYLSRPE